MLTNEIKFVLEGIIWNQLDIYNEGFQCTIQRWEVQYLKCVNSHLLPLWGFPSQASKCVLCLFKRILFTIKTVVIVLTRPTYLTVTHWISNGLYSAELRRLTRPDDEDGDSEGLAEKKISVFQPVAFCFPNLFRYEYDSLLTEVSPPSATGVQLIKQVASLL
jgi:hypothetical protein